jgi:signal transduction histidine kinase
MNKKLPLLSRRYQTALGTYLKGGRTAGLTTAGGLGRKALEAGLQTMDIVGFHEQAMVTKILPAAPRRKHSSLMRRASVFFAATVTPMVKTQVRGQEVATHLKKIVEVLGQRIVELAALNSQLNQEVDKRKAGEEALRQSERHYVQLLEQSHNLQKQLRHLSRQILSAQEEERKKISRELHDVIAQTLAGINVRLATLKNEAFANTEGLERNIAHTQQLVLKSVNIVHQFARKLRPPGLDDLGLIHALKAYMKIFSEETGVRPHLIVFAEVEQLEPSRRTVLFRVVQEALTNVGRHAQASRVDVKICKKQNRVCAEIHDNGKSFNVERVLHGKGSKRLGLLGMRERVEMVDGSFSIQSRPASGTRVLIEFPFIKAKKKTAKKSPRKKTS